MKEIKEQLKKLSGTLNEMQEYVEVNKRYPDGDINKMVFEKRVEDGIIKNFHNASEEQLIIMRDSFYWEYYKGDERFSHKPEKRVENMINELIIKKKRQKKLERVLR